MRPDQQGRGYVRVGKPALAVINGNETPEDWDDDELMYGRRRDSLGRLSGRPPRVIPAACLRELVRRKLFDTESAIRDSCVDAAKYLAAVAEGKEEPNAARMKACEMVLDRFLGKPVDRVQMSSHVEMNVNIEQAPWVVALRKAARSFGGQPLDGRVINTTVADDDIIDAEIVEALCACGCGQPPRPGSAYFNARHEARATYKANKPKAPAPNDDDLRLWRRHHGPTPPPTDSAGWFATNTAPSAPEDDPILEDDDPVLTDEDDAFIEE